LTGLVSGQIASDWKVLGQLKTRSVTEISGRTWSVGGETLDRDFADFQSYKPYLAPLGAKLIRLQAGWAKCEKTNGTYDFAWLDAIVNGAYEQGVTPWIELAYGNPIYEGGGEARLGGALPSSAAGLAAWDNWVRAIVDRYKDKVTDWEIWNEPDHGHGITPESYALFYIRTANLIRSRQPNARLFGVALASLEKTDWVDHFCRVLQREKALPLLQVFVYHGYAAAYGWAYNPDDVYPQVEKLRKIVWKYKPDVVFFQGESGAPSTPNPAAGVFKDYNWSELSQAKWDLRRMLGDHGRGIQTSLFSMSDMHYRNGEVVSVNTKGILKTNPDKTIERPKLMYDVARRVFTLFDDQLVPASQGRVTTNQINQTTFGYSHRQNGQALVTVWQHEYPPYATYEPVRTEISIANAKLVNPVMVDLISGKIYEIPQSQVHQSQHKTRITGIPVPDYPLLITSRSLVL